MPNFIEPKNLAAAQLAARDVCILDVRSPDEYAAGHLEGALNVPLDDLRTYTRTLGPDTKIVTYCTMTRPGSSRGEAAADLLVTLGLDAKALRGGLPAWRDALLPVEKSVEDTETENTQISAIDRLETQLEEAR